MALVTQIIGSYTFSQVLFLGVIFFILYMIYLKMTDDDYYSELQDIKSKYKARMWEYLSNELKIVEAKSLGNVEKILGITAETEDDTPKFKEYIMFSLVLERNLYSHVFEQIKTAIRINGFHDMNDSDLQSYIKDKAQALLEDSRKNINQKLMYYPTLRGTDSERFSIEGATAFYTKVVTKSIKLDKQSKEEIKKLKKKYSLWAKINIVGAIINKLKK